MKKVLLIFVWLFVLLPGAYRAQAQGTAFSCDGSFYQIRQVGTTSSLFQVNRSRAAYTTEPVNVRTVNGTPTNDLGVLLNGLAYNAQDGFMYALSTTGTSTTLPASVQMYKIGQGDIVLVGTVTGLPNIQVASGVIDKNGQYYVSSQNSAGTADYNLYKFNLAATTTGGRLAATAVRLRNTANTGDFVYPLYDLALNPADDQLYGVYLAGTLVSIDLVTNAATNQAPVTVINGTPLAGSDAAGSAIFDVAGNLSVYTNGTAGTVGSGKFYQVDIANGNYTLISSLDPASVSDGASCINPSFYVDVVKRVTSVSRTTTAAGLAGREYQVSFQFKVKNTGTQTLERVQVSDFLWSGSVNTTQLGSTFSAAAATHASAVAINSLSVTNNGTATLSDNFSTYTGISSATTPLRAGLLSGTQNLTAGQSATINLTVTVTYAATGNVPTTATNNQAYASALGGAITANGGFRLGATTGTLLSPSNGDLQAIDNSTNSAALPAVANSDINSPSPIYYPTTIVGNVFEDINYGGGAGRSQSASNGPGVNQAKVELYSDAGALLATATTDAAGNYIFLTGNGQPLAGGTTYRVRVVNSSVVSKRPGSNTTLVPVQTYLNGDVNRVGGENPNLVDAAANTGNQTIAALTATTAATNAVQSITPITGTGAVLTPTSGPLGGVDFGFNFDVVVNINNSGQGSLRQFVTNSNALTNANLAQSGLTAGMEYAIFMLNDGRTTGAPAGLRTGMPATGGYDSGTKSFTFSLATLPTITDSNTAIDGKLQSNLTGDIATVSPNSTAPEVIFNFLGATRGGFFVTGANTRIASVGLTNAGVDASSRSLNTTGAVLADGAAIAFDGAGATGSIVSDVTGQNNVIATMLLQNGATGITISSNVLRTARTVAAVTGNIANDGAGIILSSASGNVISNNNISANNGYGIELTGTVAAPSSANTISGNTIGGNGGGTATLKDAGISIAFGTNNLIQSNTISTNSGDGIVALSNTSGNRFTQNNISANGDLGIDLSANATLTGDGVTLNADSKAGTGANALLNFPVFTQATIDGGRLYVTGYAKAGALIELFVAAADATKFGEGTTYFANATEGSSEDADPRLANYSTASGAPTAPSSGAETGVSRFQFSFAVTSTQATSILAGGLTATATLPTTVGSLTVSSTSEFAAVMAVTNNKPLPVELVAFEAKAQSTSAQLDWNTASEKDNDHFVVERSFTGEGFEAIGTVAGHGSSAQAHSYAFTDAGIGTRYTGLVYYRLRQVDTDGTNSFSPVRTVKFTATTELVRLALYPNPATTSTTLDLTALPTGTYQVTVVDGIGRTLSAGSYAGGAAYSIGLQQAQPGTYLVLVRGAGVKLTKTLVKE